MSRPCPHHCPPGSGDGIPTALVILTGAGLVIAAAPAIVLCLKYLLLLVAGLLALAVAAMILGLMLIHRQDRRSALAYQRARELPTPVARVLPAAQRRALPASRVIPGQVVNPGRYPQVRR